MCANIHDSRIAVRSANTCALGSELNRLHVDPVFADTIVVSTPCGACGVLVVPGCYRMSLAVANGPDPLHIHQFRDDPIAQEHATLIPLRIDNTSASTSSCEFQVHHE